MRLLHHDSHTESVGHDGEQYERDEHGAFELPHELAADLLERFPHLWEVAPEPAPAAVKPKRAPAKAKPEPDSESESGDDSEGDDSDAKAPADEIPTPPAADQSQNGDSPDVAAAKPRARKTAAAAQ